MAAHTFSVHCGGRGRPCVRCVHGVVGEQLRNALRTLGHHVVDIVDAKALNRFPLIALTVPPTKSVALTSAEGPCGSAWPQNRVWSGLHRKVVRSALEEIVDLAHACTDLPRACGRTLCRVPHREITFGAQVAAQRLGRKFGVEGRGVACAVPKLQHKVTNLEARTCCRPCLLVPNAPTWMKVIK